MTFYRSKLPELDKNKDLCYIGCSDEEKRLIEVLRRLEHGSIELKKQDGEVVLVRYAPTYKRILDIKL